MGNTVGGAMGPLVRTLLGAIVGTTVKYTIGSAVGPLDGTLLGAIVEACEGPYVGPVGEVEGSYVGDLVRRIKIVKFGKAVGLK